MTIYTTKNEYIHDITPAFAEYVEDFDLDAIADDMLTWSYEQDNDGNILLNRSGWTERKDVDFWEIAEKHDTTQN